MFPLEMRQKMLAEQEAKLPVKHVAGPEEVAEAYLFLMKYVYGSGLCDRCDGTNSPAGATTSRVRELISKEAPCWFRCTKPKDTGIEIQFSHRDKCNDSSS